MGGNASARTPLDEGEGAGCAMTAVVITVDVFKFSICAPLFMINTQI